MERFWRQSFSRKVVLLESGILLGVAQLLTKLIPYSWWSRLLGPSSRPVEPIIEPVNKETVQLIGWAVRSPTILPWKPVCLPQAMAAKWMLDRRHIGSTMCIGVRKAIEKADREVDLHAWLRVGNQTITGGEVADQFQLLARFGA